MRAHGLALLGLLAALALSCRGQNVDPISGQPLMGGVSDAPTKTTYEGARQSPQRRGGVVNRQQKKRNEGRKRMMESIFGGGEGGGGASKPMPKLELAETLIGVFVIMICGLLFSGAV